MSEAEGKVVDMPNKEQPSKQPPTEKKKHILEEIEVLKLKNIGLQREILSKNQENLALQEALVVKTISERVGEDIAKWTFDIQKQVVYKT